MKSLLGAAMQMRYTRSMESHFGELIYQLFHGGSESKQRAGVLGERASLPVIDLVNVVN